jgi:predicted nucleic acid-binding protein
VTPLLFADNTVLVNFGHIGAIDILQKLANGNGRWTATVASECIRSSNVEGLASLSLIPGFLGEPLMPESRQEWVDLEVIRGKLGKPGDNTHSHMGEAETLSIISNRKIVAAFVTDDTGAIIQARSLGVRTFTTCDLLKLAVRTGMFSPVDAWEAVCILRGIGRVLPGAPTSWEAFVKYCDLSAVAAA